MRVFSKEMFLKERSKNQLSNILLSKLNEVLDKFNGQEVKINEDSNYGELDSSGIFCKIEWTKEI